RRTTFGVAADVVARGVRERGAALRAQVAVDQGTLPLAGAYRWRGDRVRDAIAAIAVVALGLAACSEAPQVPPPAATGIGLQANFVLANPAGLLALDSQGHTLGRIIDLPAQSAPATPALHPSGKSIVFALTQQPNKKTGFGSDLYTVNLDGTNFRALVEHEHDNVFYASPRFDAT